MKILVLVLLLLTGCTQAQPELRETKEVQTSIPYSDEELIESANDQIEDEAYFLDSNASIIGTGKQEFFKNIEHFLNSFKFDVEKRKNIHFEFKNLEIEENIVDDQCVFVYGSVQIYGLYDKEVTIMDLDSRFTIIYGVRDGKWKVLHIHHSIPDKEQLEDEEFPITLGKQVQQA